MTIPETQSISRQITSRPDYLDLRRQDLNSTYRPQREWIEGRGILIVIAHFFAGIGAGAWIFSILFDYRTGETMAAVSIGLSGLAHLAFLGRWQRFLRILARPNSSWVSRGMWGTVLYGIGALGYMLPGVRDTLMGSISLGISLFGVALVLLCSGYVYSVSKAIPFWHTVLVPVLYIAYGLRGGIALLLVAAVFGGNSLDIDTMEAIKLWVLASTIVLILFYLIIANRSGGASSYSVHELVAGRISVAFYGGTIGIGILVPLALAIGREFGLAGMLTLGMIGFASLVGDFYIKYCVVKAGTYVPLGDAVVAVSPKIL